MQFNVHMDFRKLSGIPGQRHGAIVVANKIFHSLYTTVAQKILKPTDSDSIYILPPLVFSTKHLPAPGFRIKPISKQGKIKIEIDPRSLIAKRFLNLLLQHHDHNTMRKITFMLEDALTTTKKSRRPRPQKKASIAKINII